MRIKRKIYISLIVFMICSLFLGAQNVVKIGVVDSQKILYNSDAGKDALAQLDKKTKEYQTKLEKLNEEISDLENKITTQRLTLSPEALDKLGNDLQKKRTEKQRFMEDSQRELVNLKNRLFDKIRKEVLPIIQQIGKEKGFTLIVDLMESGAIYWDQTVDITDEVIRRYNTKKAGK